MISFGDYVGLRLDEATEQGTNGFFYGKGVGCQATGTGLRLAGTGGHHVAYAIDSTGHVRTLYIDGGAQATTPYTSGLGTGIRGKHAPRAAWQWGVHLCVQGPAR